MKHSKNHLVLIPVLLLISLLYAGHFDNGFHFDDVHTVTGNPWIRDIGNIPSYYTLGAETFSNLPQNQMYRPLVSTTLAIDYAISRWISGDANAYDPLVYHIDSFLWFLLVVILVYYLAYRLARLHEERRSSTLIAALAALAFGIHGAIGETVNYIIARSDILSTAAILGGLALFAAFPRGRKFGFYLLPVIAGMFAKATTAMFWPVFLAWLVLFEGKLSFMAFLSGLFSGGERGKAARHLLLRSLPSLLVIAISGAFTLILMRGDEFYPSSFSRMEYLVAQPWSILHYFITFLAPLQLSADSDWTILPGIADIRFLAGIAFLAILAFTAFRLSSGKSTRIISFALAFFLFTLLPTSSIIPLSEVVNDHRLFLPFSGLAIGLAWAVFLLWRRLSTLSKGRWTGYALFACLGAWMVFQAITLVNRNGVWHDDASLWKDVTVKSPRNGRGLMNYGLTLMQDAHYDEALNYFNKALEFNPYYPYLHTNLAIAYNAVNDVEKARYYFDQAIHYGSNLNEIHYFYARFLGEKGRQAEAIYHLRECYRLSPGYLPAHYMLMQYYSEQEAWDLLREMARSTLTLSPNDETATAYLDYAEGRTSRITAMRESLKDGGSREDYLNLSLSLYNVGDFEGCIDACRQALVMDPSYAEAYNNICSAYNMLGMWKEAMAACDSALQINPAFELARNNFLYAKMKAGE